MLNFDAHTDPPSFIWLCYKLVPYKYNYTEQNYKRNTFFYVHKRPISLKYCSQICLNLLVSTFPLPR